MAFPTGPSSSPMTTSGSAADHACAASTSASPVRRTNRSFRFFLFLPAFFFAILNSFSACRMRKELVHFQRGRFDFRMTDDSRRNAGHGAMRRDRIEHDAAGGHFGAFTDFDVSQDRGPGSD